MKLQRWNWIQWNHTLNLVPRPCPTFVFKKNAGELVKNVWNLHVVLIDVTIAAVTVEVLKRTVAILYVATL